MLKLRMGAMLVLLIFAKQLGSSTPHFPFSIELFDGFTKEKLSPKDSRYLVFLVKNDKNSGTFLKQLCDGKIDASGEAFACHEILSGSGQTILCIEKEHFEMHCFSTVETRKKFSKWSPSFKAYLNRTSFPEEERQ